ncbi:MAG TPA: hypothetical protein VG096_19995 [Bryobacteraceae bacterium]|nr:hypothetical protein [Bryobacteraceae bacterium]
MIGNLLAWRLQIATLVVVAALTDRTLRLRVPGGYCSARRGELWETASKDRVD